MSERNGAAEKVAIVTGGSRGLGRDMVRSIAGRGTDVIFTYHTNEAEADAVVAEVEEMGRRAAALRLDVGDSGTFGDFAAEVRDTLEEWGTERFDFLVNNAGIGTYASIADTTEEQFDRLFDIHVKGMFFLTQRLLPLISDGGRIVNVSTGLVRIITPGHAAYASAKGAVEVLMKYMAAEMGERGIAVNTIAPGAIETDFNGGRVRDDPETNREISSVTALGRVGLPEDIGGVVASLLSPEMSWVNAQRIEASGGQSL